jgi:RNA polymerase sigma factor (sigma-70 family)
MSDSVLLAAKNGSVEAVNELVTKVQGYICTIAKSFLGTNHPASIDAEDLMQDALLEVIRDLPECRAETMESFMAWCGFIVRNRVYNAIKAAKTVKRGRGVKHLPIDEIEVSSGRSHEAAVEASEQLEIILKLASGQNEQMRSVVELMAQGDSFAEICEKLQLTKFAAYATMKRFRAKVAEAVA